MSIVGDRGEEEWLKGFGESVRARRVELGISQEVLGYRSGLDRTYVSGIERGVRNPTLITVRKLAEGLEVRPSELLERTEDGLWRS